MMLRLDSAKELLASWHFQILNCAGERGSLSCLFAHARLGFLNSEAYVKVCSRAALARAP